MTERAEVLNMLASGKITPEEGARLLAALSDAAPHASERPAGNAAAEDRLGPRPGRTPHWFHVRVSDGATGHAKVNVTLPLAIVRFGLQIGGRFAPEIAGFDADELLRALQSAPGVPLVDVQDNEDGEHVQIYVD
jgi:hypothetical protein